jgi:hypothetical protein
VHPGIGCEVGGRLAGVGGLLEVVQLRAQEAGEVPGQTAQVGLLGPGPALGGASCQVPQDLDVHLDFLGRAGPAHLDHHIGPVVEGGGVDWRDGGGRQRLGIEAGEGLGRGGAELGADDVFDDLG